MFRKLEKPMWVLQQSVLESILDRRHWVHYLDIIDGPFREYIENPLDQRAIEFLSGHVAAYMQKGVEPPDEIRTTVVNVADDLLAGRDPMIRTGDYIAIQMMLRQHKR